MSGGVSRVGSVSGLLFGRLLLALLVVVDLIAVSLRWAGYRLGGMSRVSRVDFLLLRLGRALLDVLSLGLLGVDLLGVLRLSR